MRESRVGMIIGCLMALALWGGEAVRYRQADGTEVALPTGARRVVPAYASLAVLWDFAGGRAVGAPTVPAKQALPASMRDLPSTGTPIVPNAERIVALRPDLVLLVVKYARHRALAEQLRSMGVAAACLKYDHYDDFRELARLFIRLTGGGEPRLAALKRVEQEVEAVCAKSRRLGRPKCAIVFAAASGFTLESPQTSTGLMAAMLGAENVVRGKGPLRVRFSYEQLLLENPEVIFVVTMGDAAGLRRKFEQEFMAQPAWKAMKAARDGRVHFLPPELFLYMPGPEYPRAFRQLARLLHPKGGF